MKVDEMKAFVEGLAQGFEEGPEERLYTGKEIAQKLRQAAVTAGQLGLLFGVMEK